VFEIGNSLREARLRQELDFPEIEQATKIRAKYLRALEEEQFDVLPAQTYVKGFLRTYADYLGLDGELYVDEFNSRYVVGEEEPPLSMRRTTSSGPPLSSRIESRGVLLALLAIGAVFALVIAAWKFGSPNKQRYEGVGPGSAQPTTVARQPKQPARTRRPAPLRTKLVLTAAYGSCWLQVRAGSARGPQVYEGTLEQGQPVAFSPRRRFWIAAGAPGNLVARVNGRRVAIPGNGTSGNFIVGPSGFRQAPSGA
jgi:cytoskeleton protein RodZ